MSSIATLHETSDHRLRDHVARLEQEHPPLDVADVDFSLRDAAGVAARYGRVLDYMARVELEVERNVLELNVLLPEPPEVDRYFYLQVWAPQEIQHGLILDRLQAELGLRPSAPDVSTVSLKIRLLGTVAHVPAVQDVVRMLYYLTGMTTERTALLAYHRLQDGLASMGERAIAQTAIAPIRRQEPGHFAFYQLSSRALWERMPPWQRWLTRRLRAVSFAPVGANSEDQHRQVGEMMVALGIDDPERTAEFTATVARLEAELLRAQDAGLGAPPYVERAFARCLELAVG